MRKDRLLERVFSQAEGRSGGDARGTFFDIFKGQLGACFRLSSGSDGKDGLEPLDSQGKPLLGDDGRPMTTTEFLDQMRIHPVYGFLFQQRGPAGMQAAGAMTASGIGSNGEPINPPGDVGIGAVSGFLRGEWAGCSSLRSGDGKEAPQLLCRSRRFEVSSINSRSRSLPTSAASDVQNPQLAPAWWTGPSAPLSFRTRVL